MNTAIAAATEHAPGTRLQFDSFSIEFIKFLAWVIGACFFFVGYAYTLGFYAAFGIHMSDIESDYTSFLTRALIVFQDVRVPLCLALAVIVLFGLYRLTWGWRQFKAPLVAMVSILLVFLAGRFGDYIGRDHASEIISGASGKIAYCILKPDSMTDKMLGERHKISTQNHAYKKIRETQTTMYLIDTSWKGRGHVLGLDKADISFCRIFGG